MEVHSNHGEKKKLDMQIHGSSLLSQKIYIQGISCSHWMKSLTRKRNIKVKNLTCSTKKGFEFHDHTEEDALLFFRVKKEAAPFKSCSWTCAKDSLSSCNPTLSLQIKMKRHFVRKVSKKGEKKKKNKTNKGIESRIMWNFTITDKKIVGWVSFTYENFLTIPSLQCVNLPPYFQGTHCTQRRSTVGPSVRSCRRTRLQYWIS